MESVYNEIQDPQTIRLKNFDEDLKSGLVLCSLIESYVGDLKSVSTELKNLRIKLTDEVDYQINLNKLLNCLKNIKLMVPIKNYKELTAPHNQREILLFCAQLYMQLPCYIPKSTIRFEGLLE